MKKIYNILLSFVFAGCLLGSCDYLDIVPNETANEEMHLLRNKLH